jgi:hypothetical protein
LASGLTGWFADPSHCDDDCRFFHDEQTMAAEPRNAYDEETSNDIAPGTKQKTEDVEEGGDPSRTTQDEAASEAGFESTPMQAKNAVVDDATTGVEDTSACSDDGDAIDHRDESRKYRIFAAVFSIVIVLSITVGLAVGLTRTQEALTAPPTLSPAVGYQSPSASPTSEMTSSFQSSLPLSTVVFLLNPRSPQSRAFQWITEQDHVPFVEAPDDEERRIPGDFVLCDNQS